MSLGAPKRSFDVWWDPVSGCYRSADLTQPGSGCVHRHRDVVTAARCAVRRDKQLAEAKPLTNNEGPAWVCDKCGRAAANRERFSVCQKAGCGGSIQPNIWTQAEISAAYQRVDKSKLRIEDCPPYRAEEESK